MLIISSCCDNTTDQAKNAEIFPVPAIRYQPRNYVCQQTVGAISIDGLLNEESWQKAKWTSAFIDIEGDSKPKPRFNTQAKMLWDDDFFYISAKMEEPDLWATLTERDAVIFHDNDFEVFIDPNGDSHEYYELEINALGTEWDLLLIKPYRDGAPAVNAWDIQGLKTAVALNGTLNDPSDRDTGWTIEIAIPWKVLKECAHRPVPPLNGDIWWVNFSRVQWQLESIDNRYSKIMDSTGTRSLPENNWVWSPQGLIAMHYPERWGLVQFSTTAVNETTNDFSSPKDLPARTALWQLYYAERQFEMNHNRFTSCLSDLDLEDYQFADYNWPPDLQADEQNFRAVLKHTDASKSLSIGTDGRLETITHDPQEK